MPGLRHYLAERGEEVIRACAQARYRCGVGPMLTGVLPGLARWALDTLRESERAAIPTDKDGGYGLIRRQELKLEKLRCIGKMIGSLSYNVLCDDRSTWNP